MLKNIISLLILLTYISCDNKPSRSEIDRSKVKRINYNLTDSLTKDVVLDSMLSHYRVEKNRLMSKVLTKSNEEFTKSRPQSNLTTLMAKICFEQSSKYLKKPIDFSLVNLGGIRSSLPKGDITLENAYTLMPFDNELCVLEIKSDSVKSMVNYLIDRGGEPISGLAIHFKDSILSEILINDKPLKASKSYFVATTDYLANGGDKMDFFKNPLNRFDLSVKYRDEIIHYFEKTSILKSKPQTLFYYE